ncbi:hypothetical protein GGD70_005379 [Paraburkholderia fungorum]|jgi:hypothetical protein|nr:hypothetical protein [Paraburkholderia fungorum]
MVNIAPVQARPDTFTPTVLIFMES